MKLLITILLLLSMQLVASEKFLLNYEKGIVSEIKNGIKTTMLEHNHKVIVANCSSDSCIYDIIEKEEITNVVLIEKDSNSLQAEIINLETTKKEKIKYRFNNYENNYFTGKSFSMKILSKIAKNNKEVTTNNKNNKIEATNKNNYNYKNDYNEAKYWLTGSLGVAPSIDGIGGSLSFNFLTKNSSLFEIKLLLTDELQILGGDNPNESFMSIGLLYGYSSVKKYTILKIAGGVSVANTIMRGRMLDDSDTEDDWLEGNDYERIDEVLLSLPLELEFILKYKYVGIGLNFSAELNTRKPMFTAMLNLSIGKL